MTLAAATNGAGLPDMTVSVRQVFGIDTDLEVPAYSQVDEHVPDVDPDYLFNREVTLAILAGFKHNRRVMIQGYPGRACASISTAMSAASISSARTPS
jgi:cobaltochelatase CobS